MTTSYKLELRKGTVIVGKWKRRQYRVEKLLGEGANGKVYLVEHGRAWYAMKVGMDAVDLQSEINVLQTIAGQRRSGREAFLIDVDDFVSIGGREHPFYIMRYVRGVTLTQFMERHGAEWFPLLGLHLLNRLSDLHRAGWVFGDLKMENVMALDYGHVELIDYGGVTAAGKSVRQFTEIYDRGYWNMGSRSADSGYDLFSFGVLCLQLHEPKRLLQLTKELLPQNRSAEELLELAEGHAALKPYAGWLSRAFHGGFQSTAEASELWRQLMHRRELARHNGVPLWMKGLFAASVLLLAGSVYWLLRNGL
ncbi:protein kinase domain-containing protein [Paenibacillus protaetiae]|uniref:Serine/threonine protein kinase n=1 Tax=Paenibacillus protaetiae TaxID=2509456 RepID=A0A4V0YFE5_9BACL|nr:serine/threonine protein kinase [Paenibacillus protaetiae]QAY67431.1 serine/threonine protein kinase [Paenibacillus protaetiae]